MILGKILPISIGFLALSGMVYTFINGSSPYVTIEQAKTASGDRLHLKGKIVPGTLRTKTGVREVHFVLQDDQRSSVPVIYYGMPLANMGTATEVVAIGQMQGDSFRASKMLLKCPSKYESNKQQG